MNVEVEAGYLARVSCVRGSRSSGSGMRGTTWPSGFQPGGGSRLSRVGNGGTTRCGVFEKLFGVVVAGC